MKEQTTDETPLSLLIQKETPPDSNDYREASLQFLRILTLAVEFITTSDNCLLAAYGVAYALDVPSVTDVSIRERSRQLNVSHNSISHYSATFKKIANL